MGQMLCNSKRASVASVEGHQHTDYMLKLLLLRQRMPALIILLTSSDYIFFLDKRLLAVLIRKKKTMLKSKRKRSNSSTCSSRSRALCLANFTTYSDISSIAHHTPAKRRHSSLKTYFPKESMMVEWKPFQASMVF